MKFEVKLPETRSKIMLESCPNEEGPTAASHHALNVQFAPWLFL